MYYKSFIYILTGQKIALGLANSKLPHEERAPYCAVAPYCDVRPYYWLSERTEHFPIQKRKGYKECVERTSCIVPWFAAEDEAKWV